MNRIIASALFVLVLPLAACQPSDPPPAAGTESAETAAADGCERNPPAEPMACTMDWRPVCGCDGVTYPNACGAKAAGIADYSEGECEQDSAE